MLHLQPKGFKTKACHEKEKHRKNGKNGKNGKKL
jgi:hypothetical protein